MPVCGPTGQRGPHRTAYYHYIRWLLLTNCTTNSLNNFFWSTDSWNNFWINLLQLASWLDHWPYEIYNAVCRCHYTLMCLATVLSQICVRFKSREKKKVFTIETTLNTGGMQCTKEEIIITRYGNGNGMK